MKNPFVLIITVFIWVVLTGIQTHPASAVETDPDFEVDVYNADNAFHGTTLIGDNHRRGQPRIIELNMKGYIVWEYEIPAHLSRYTNPGFDVECLSNSNVA